LKDPAVRHHAIVGIGPWIKLQKGCGYSRPHALSRVHLFVLVSVLLLWSASFVALWQLDIVDLWRWLNSNDSINPTLRM